MKAKLDENLGTRGAEPFSAAGWDVATVVGQKLCSAGDATIIEICRVEKRVLITLDTDFSNTLRFRPSRYAGIIVLRLSPPIRLADIHEAALRVIDLAGKQDPEGKLWIVDEKRIREFVEQD